MIFKSTYGIIKDNYLVLYKLKSKSIIISEIAEIKILKRDIGSFSFINKLKPKLYDFIIIMDNQEKNNFTFRKKHLTKILEFKTQICHTKFCLQDSNTEN
jgi:hypothetical protein